MTAVDASALPAGVLLREAVATDVPTLVELARAFYDEDGFTTTDDELRAHFAILLPAPHARVTLATRDGDARGFALTTIGFTLESGTVAELQDLYVHPAHRRRGLATLLVDDAVEWARRASASVIELVIAPNGRDVRHLFTYYEARGFVDGGRRILGRRLS